MPTESCWPAIPAAALLLASLLLAPRGALRASSAGIALPPAAEQGKEAKKRESPDRTVLDSFQQNKKRSKVNPLSLFNSLLLRFFFFCATQNRIARSALPRSAKAGQAKKRIVARRK
jgi:hypothetical protein